MYENEINIQWQTDKHWGNQVNFIGKEVSSRVLIHCMIHVFMHYRLNKLIETVIKETYYFADSDEIDRIAEITNRIISEKENTYHLNEPEEHIEPLLYELFKSNLTDKKVIHYDSVIQFRMKPFQNYLIDRVGRAIDEFKREEEHQ